MGCVSSSAANDRNEDDIEDVKARAAQQRRKLSMAPANVGPIVKKGEEDKIKEEYGEYGSRFSEAEAQARGPIRHHLVSVKGIVPYSKNKVNQDRGVIQYALAGNPRVSMFGVMDGHGEFGHDVSEFIKQVLPKKFETVSDICKDPEKAILQCTKAMSDELDDDRSSKHSINTAFSGSTLVYSLLIDRKTLYVANVGDSRCVVCRSGSKGGVAVELSEDQKPENPGEKKRILEAGGRVEPLPGPPDEDLGPQRVWLAEVDVPGLAMSRSIGDQVSKTVGVISVPEIRTHTVKPEDEFMILASDGVWEFVSSQEAVDIVWKYRHDLNLAAHELVKESIARWKKEEEVVDDTTCVVVGFNHAK